ncbi:MAG: ATP-dependent RecD-like DNA helicase, partial [Holosporaceae bacterium]|nr:ATP-dependent RecD-like DNA helicase [Holosporaceae bacterium]
AFAYAVSIHKSQGSEYPVVVIPLVMSHYLMLQRNLLYTGITRGKKLVVVIGSKKALFLAIKNNNIAGRNTRLRERLCEKV